MPEAAVVDVVIVGGAATGSAAAYFLAAHPGFDGSVLVLEQDFGYQRCATTLSAASIRHQFSTPENIRMSQFGTQFIRDIDRHLSVDGVAPDVAFHEAGYLFLATEAGRSVLEGNHRVQRSLGVDVMLLDPDELSVRFPWLATGDLAGGSLGLSGEGWLDAHSLMHGFRRKAISIGVRYREASVCGLVRDGRRVTGLTLADGSRISAGCVINAAGTGAAALAASIGIVLPVESRKRCVFFVESPAELACCPMLIDASGVWLRPEGRGFICGIAPAGANDPECFDFEVEHRLFDDVIWPALAQRVPGFEALRVRHAWAGHYDVNTLDHNMILGAHPEVDGLLFANGFSGHGLQHSPAVGRALAELVVDGGFRSMELGRLGWGRVLLQEPLREINVV